LVSLDDCPHAAQVRMYRRPIGNTGTKNSVNHRVICERRCAAGCLDVVHSNVTIARVFTMERVPKRMNKMGPFDQPVKLAKATLMAVPRPRSQR
jgi:altronate dehydratase